jgi:hypothetical protein
MWSEVKSGQFHRWFHFVLILAFAIVPIGQLTATGFYGGTSHHISTDRETGWSALPVDSVEPGFGAIVITGFALTLVGYCPRPITEWISCRDEHPVFRIRPPPLF